ncbi:MAG: tetratricopeptide repeat protein [Synergistaceae bacterium]|nr:tetratricopeptide repeat protein [Synergistaceae bacterium]
MNDDWQELCPLCLRPKPEEGECPHCHWPGDVLRWSPQALPPGTILAGRYRTGRMLGQGGFALTYLALDQSLKMRLCVKEYFPANLAQRSSEDGTVRLKDPDGLDAFREGKSRFLHEARILARFEGHPGIVPARDLFEERGTVYIVTGYLEGVTLKQYLRNQGGMIPFDRALSIFMPVMDSLRAVHKASVIHRDVSPENIFLTTEGQVKLLDFGSALSLDSADRGFTVVVKPGYAPVEQYEAQGDQGPWTDVYGLAASFYRALTGQLPPTGPDRLAGKELKAPSLLGVDLSPAREAVLLKALSVDSRDRYEDIQSFQEALLGADETPEEVPAGGAGHFVATLLLFMALALGGWWGWNGLSPRRLQDRGLSFLAKGEPQKALPLLERALSRSEIPPSSLLLALAEAQIGAGQAREGLASLARVETMTGLPPEGLLLAGRAHQQLGEGDKALAFLREAARLIGDDLSLWLATAQSAFSAGRLEVADEAWRKALALDPTHPEALLGLAELSERRNRHDEALRFRKDLAEREQTAEAWRALARLQEERGNEEERLEAWRRVVSLAPEEPDGWKALGAILMGLKRHDEAIEAFRRQVALSPDDGEGWRDLGLALLESGKAEEASQALYRASALRPGDSRIWEGLGRAWSALGRLHDAEGAYRRALEIDPSRASWHHALGVALLGQNRHAEAAAALGEAVRRDPQSPAYRLALARALAGSGQEEPARELLGELLASAPSPEAWLLLARLEEARGAFEEAVKAFETATRLDSRAMAPLLGLGRCLLALGDPAQALVPLLEALRLAPAEPEAIRHVGRAYLELGRQDEAVSYLKEYLRLMPDDDEGWRLLSEAYLRQNRPPTKGESDAARPEPTAEESLSDETVPIAVPEPAPVSEPESAPAAEPAPVPEPPLPAASEDLAEGTSPDLPPRPSSAEDRWPGEIALPGRDRTIVEPSASP